MKTSLCTEVDLTPGHIVLDGDAALELPPQNGLSSAHLFSAHVYCGHGRPSQLLLSSCLKVFFVSQLQCDHLNHFTYQLPYD